MIADINVESSNKLGCSNWKVCLVNLHTPSDTTLEHIYKLKDSKTLTRILWWCNCQLLNNDLQWYYLTYGLPNKHNDHMPLHKQRSKKNYTLNNQKGMKTWKHEVSKVLFFWRVLWFRISSESILRKIEVWITWKVGLYSQLIIYIC